MTCASTMVSAFSSPTKDGEMPMLATHLGGAATRLATAAAEGRVTQAAARFRTSPPSAAQPK